MTDEKNELYSISKKRLGGIVNLIQDLLTMHKDVRLLVEQNTELRKQVIQLQNQVYHLSGQFQQIDKRIEHSVELHVLKMRSDHEQRG